MEIDILLKELQASHWEYADLMAKVDRLLAQLETHHATQHATTPAPLPSPIKQPRPTRAKCQNPPDWDSLPEWLTLREASDAARLSTNSFKPWARAHRIRTRPFGKLIRFHRDDIRGFKP